MSKGPQAELIQIRVGATLEDPSELNKKKKASVNLKKKKKVHILLRTVPTATFRDGQTTSHVNPEAESSAH